MLSLEDRNFLFGLSHIIKFNQFNRIQPTSLTSKPKRNLHRKINSLDFNANLRAGIEVNVIRKSSNVLKKDEIASSNDPIMKKNISFEKIDEISINNEKTTVPLHFDEASFIRFPEDCQSVSLPKTERTDFPSKEPIRKGSIFESPEINYDLLGDQELDTAKKIVNALENDENLIISEHNNNNDDEIKFINEHRIKEKDKNGEDDDELLTFRKFPSLHLIENYDVLTLKINGEEKNLFSIPKLAKTLKKEEDTSIGKKTEKNKDEGTSSNDRMEKPPTNEIKKNNLNAYQKALLNELKTKDQKYVIFNGRKIHQNLFETINNLERLLGGTVQKIVEVSPSITYNNLDRDLKTTGRKKKALPRPLNFDLI